MYSQIELLLFLICLWILHNQALCYMSPAIPFLQVGPRQKPKRRRIAVNPAPPHDCQPLPPTSKKTLVIDLDQTLIYSFSRPLPSNRYSFTEMLMLDFGTGQKYHVIRRPGVEQLFRSAVASGYEIVIFTASSKNYACPILDWLDPTGEFISHRLYRDACSKDINRTYFKDLGTTGRLLDRSVIIEDDPGMFWRHYDNMICVTPFKGDLKDVELHSLLCFFVFERMFQDLRHAVNLYYSFPSITLKETYEE
ncbi:hypothetical protein LUZ60_013175 [Juncus effusus]|nr:hypothetical protein LUZ60_013175 [Juncus effusus]